MRPVLVEVGGLPIGSAAASTVLAALVATLLLASEFGRLGWRPSLAWSFVLRAAVAALVGGALSSLARRAPDLSRDDLLSPGVTAPGAIVGALAAFLWFARRQGLPVASFAAVAVAPLSLAYGIGRLGGLLAGDGTYGVPTDLPWGMAFPDGEVPTMVPVHPTALYDALAAFLIAGLLWWVRRRWLPAQTVALYALLTGLARLLVESVRVDEQVLSGLTSAQLSALALLALGPFLLAGSDGRAGPARPAAS